MYANSSEYIRGGQAEKIEMEAEQSGPTQSFGAEQFNRHMQAKHRLGDG